MASSKTISSAVQAAVRAAHIDLSAAREHLDERVRFDVDALARVLRLSTLSADDYNRVIADCHTEMYHQMDERDVARALASLRLQERVTAPRLWVRQGPDSGIEILRDS